MTALSSADFLDIVRKSQLVEEQKLDPFLEQLQAHLPMEPRVIAQLFIRNGLLTHFQAQQLLLGKWRKFTVGGKYKLLELLGAGGMGKVFLCEHIHLHTLVAVKVLLSERTKDASAVDRFYWEARAVASLNHPNIVRAHDVDRDGNLHFIVMDYVDGASLHDIVMKTGPLDCARAAHYISQAATGLQNAHQAGWVHRDIKPSNILVDREGIVKILDLGLARLFLDQNDQLTKAFEEKAVLGTADFLAPEQGMDSHEVDIRADIYGLGGTFYFLLAGVPPFGNQGSTTQKLVWHQLRQPNPIQDFRSDLAEEMAAVVDKMMAKDPEERFQTPAEVVEALRPWTQSPIDPPSAEEMPVLSPAVRRLATPGSGPSSSPRTAPPVQGKRGQDSSSVPSDLLPPGSESGPKAPPSKVAAKRSAADTALPSRSPSTPQGISKPGKSQMTRPAPSLGPRKTHAGQPSSRKSGATSSVLINRQSDQPTDASPSRLTLGSSVLKTASQQRVSKRTAIGLIGIALLATGGLGIWWMFFREDPRKKEFEDMLKASMAAAGDLSINLEGALVVTQKVTKDGFHLPDGHSNFTFFKGRGFTTLQQALASAKASDRIVVVGQDLVEQVTMDGSKLPPNLTIEAASIFGQPVVWRPPAKEKSGSALVEIANVKGMVIKGFTLDGDSRVDDLVLMTGNCAGMKLEDLHFQGFKRSALYLQNCSGESDEPITLNHLRVIAGPAGERPAAVIFDTKAGAALPPNQHQNFLNCRFEGPFKAAVQLAGPVLFVEFHRNRFFRATNAFLFQGNPSILRLRLTIISNTFSDCKTAFHFEKLPSFSDKDQDNRVLMRNNLFQHTGALFRLDELADSARAKELFPKFEGNVQDPASGTEGLLFLTAKPVPFDPLTLNPRDDAQFLRYGRPSPLNQAGAGKTPVGVPPE